MCTCFVEEYWSWVLFLKKTKEDSSVMVASSNIFWLVLQNSSLPKHVVIHEFSLKLFKKSPSLVVVYNGLCVWKYLGTVKFLPVICLLRHPTCIHERHFISNSNSLDRKWQEFSKCIVLLLWLSPVVLFCPWSDLQCHTFQLVCRRFCTVVMWSVVVSMMAWLFL
jgi:hypothetical protein